MADLIELVVERAVAGGRMLARHDGRVVFVRGAIPGERVKARVEKRQKQVLFAEAVDVLEPSPDRRSPHCDLACGGSSYAHIAYARQLVLKADVVADAFARIAKRELPAPVVVAASPERGYRMRARLHVSRGELGFFREGSHELCRAETTGQLLPEAMAAARGFAAANPALMSHLSGITISENVAATSRLLLLESAEAGVRLPTLDGPGCAGIDGIASDRAQLWGAAAIHDTAGDLWPDAPPVPAETRWSRRAASFFQGNRFLLGALVAHVLDEIDDARRLVDLYAGGGLFSVAAAARGVRVTAVESDGSSARDLADNAAPFDGLITPLVLPVEAAFSRLGADSPDALVLDPPRIGASADAIAGIIGAAPARIVYVSCDAPTLARDCARLFAAGYAISGMAAFDLFPNTPHVETVVTLTRR